MIGQGRRTAVDDSAQKLTDPDPEKRKAAIEAFKGIGASQRERALKRAVPLLRHEDPGVREAVSEAMQGMLGTEEAAVVAAAAATVGKYRRRFPGPAGWADMESEEEDEDEEEGAAGGQGDGSHQNESSSPSRAPSRAPSLEMKL